ncbi:MAG TPA: DUF2285 domain-containing protein [Stellaceae bacterium]|nr:DUF2285 domain-containing protein [Stellaceae bacterium]
MTRSRVDLNPTIADDVPWSDTITAYDEAHFVVYLRLLDASADGASDEEMARIVLGIDPRREPERARRALESHLRRARWMTETGYRHLLRD